MSAARARRRRCRYPRQDPPPRRGPDDAPIAPPKRGRSPRPGRPPRDRTPPAPSRGTRGSRGPVRLAPPLVPVIGREITGARIWIGLSRFNFEPWEAVRILLVVFFAAYLEEFREVITHSRRMGPF